MDFPSHFGLTFTPTIHTHAEGPTLPENNKPSSSFVVVVTGAGKGLGYHISLAYARAGATGICITSRTQSDLDALSKELRSINPKIDVLAEACDASNPDAVKSLAETVARKFSGQLDVVIANAGVISKYITHGSDNKTDEQTNRRLPVGIIEDDDFKRVIDINLLGSYYVAKYFTPALLSKANPSTLRAYIVITSMAAHAAQSSFVPVAYNMSKLANIRMAEHMHNDHSQDGLLAFAVHPGAVLTPQTEFHSTKEGDSWDALLTDDIGLCGGFLTWLTKERREWLSGRYLAAAWDVDELETMQSEIMEHDKLKFTMVV
ncbi:hypothetical protein EDD37DRAFT_636481 [Exophiala viscosa]|uniref:NAD(P)-binding protein n=1 Tax=Exophiala viscosa TaxID=2486360 RepID=A0AAN6E0K4_9EURO|nr:hypothetical protein EDD36DRAFT_191751 [Exophiala viscosa]KAI1621898.1 hypothetical protein EDD37DRAFT_636481 [Exophiala viscosa]